MKKGFIFTLALLNLLISSCREESIDLASKSSEQNARPINTTKVSVSKTLEISSAGFNEVTLRGKAADIIFSAAVFNGTQFHSKYYENVQDILNDVTATNDFQDIQEARCYAEYVLTSSNVMAGQVALLSQIVVPSFFRGNVLLKIHINILSSI